MNWWKKLFEESIGGSRVTPLDKEVSSNSSVSVAVIKEKNTLPKKKPIRPLNLMKVKFVKAANQSKRKDIVRGICLHHIMMGSFKQNEEFLVSKESRVSCHYVCGRNAELTQMVNTTKKGWHVGVSSFVIDGKERDNLNNCLIGIEIVNPGFVTKNKTSGRYWYNCGGKIVEWKGNEPVMSSITYPNGKTLSGYSVPYTEKQINKIVALCKALVVKYPSITRENIVTHYQVSTPIGRKNDPFGFDVEAIKDLIFN